MLRKRIDVPHDFRRRHHYATTGARIWLDVSAAFSEPATIFHTNPGSGPSSYETVTTAMMGDIVSVGDDVFDLTVEILATAPIERVEIRDGLDVLDVAHPYRVDQLGRRVRVVWEGAETRSRGRNAVWDGTATFAGNRVQKIESINFWNVERPPHQIGDSHIAWSSFTTGSFSGFDAWLEHGTDGILG